MSQIILKALDYDTGKAYFLKNKKLYLIYAPYEMGDWYDAYDQNLSDALLKQDFESCSESFDDIYAMINFIEEKLNWKDDYTEEESEEAEKNYILAMPTELVKQFLIDLKSATTEQNPDWQHFSKLCNIVAENEDVQKSPELNQLLAEIKAIIKPHLQEFETIIRKIFAHIDPVILHNTEDLTMKEGEGLIVQDEGASYSGGSPAMTDLAQGSPGGQVGKAA